MKRTELKRRTSLKRKPPKQDSFQDREDWKKPKSGYCECGCDPPAFHLHLERHHILELQYCKREGAPLYDLANSMLLHPHHHHRHTSASRRIPLESIPEAALEFAAKWLGEGAAANYFERHYGCQRRRAA